MARPSTVAAAVAVAVLAGVFLTPAAAAVAAPGVLVPVPRGPREKVAKLGRPVPWVGGDHVHGNSTKDSDVIEGVLALDGRFALIVQHEHLPFLAPIKTTFTVRAQGFRRRRQCVSKKTIIYDPAGRLEAAGWRVATVPG
jgi:hypothetical protein